MISMSRATAIYSRDKNEAVSQKPVISRKPRIDWKELKRQAETGHIPAPPQVSYMQASHVSLARYIERNARGGNIRAVQDLSVRACNSGMSIVAKYREICLIALEVLGQP